jgi:hypothetical protein
MTRTLLAIAAALFAATTFFSPAAKACVSCEYTPPVVNTPVYSHHVKHYRKRRIYKSVKRRARRIKRHIVESQPAPKKVETAKTAPVSKDVKSENSTISTASADKGETIEAKATQSDEPEVEKAVGCKKFFASVGMTLTVPCE